MLNQSLYKVISVKRSCQTLIFIFLSLRNWRRSLSSSWTWWRTARVSLFMKLQSSRLQRKQRIWVIFLFLMLMSGKYHCPVLYNVFTNNSHIVANKLTGNVFSYEVSTFNLLELNCDTCCYSLCFVFIVVYCSRLWSSSTLRPKVLKTCWRTNRSPGRIW